MRPRPERLHDYREYPVLYVDDEPENLRIFELTFRRDFSIVTASTGEEGLDVLTRQPVALVLSDHRMPNMTGADFLARVAEVDPKTVRIMVTAYGDVETLQHAINDGHIYSYVPKPWSPDEVRATLRRAIDVYALDREREQLLRELALLNRVSASLARELDLDRLLRLLLETMHEEMGYDAVGILFLEPEGALTWARLGPGNDDVEPQLRDLRITPEAAPRFLEGLHHGDQKILCVEEALDYEGPVRRWVTEVAAEQILVSPLHGKDGVIGALVVDNRRGGARFSADDRTLVEGLSNQASIAIENARLVDDLRRSREQVRRADRLGTLGTLAAGLAHEINNPLVSIHTFLSMAPEKRQADDAEFWGSYYDLACREVGRIRGLVETMRRLGSGNAGTTPRQPIEIASIVDEVVTLLRREAELSHVDLAAECDAALPKLVVARDQIHQVVLNLLLNAIAATPEGGRVAVRVGPCAAGEAEGVEIEVSDSGPGIPPDHLDQIFDPFFTTKDPDEGSGLGLMVCHRIVTDHGGTIEVRSQEAEGATFIVRLPAGADDGGGDQPLDPSVPDC